MPDDVFRFYYSSQSEEKKDIFAPVADLMVGVVFIFIIMVMALSLSITDEATVPLDTFVSMDASRQRLADFVRHFKNAGVAPMLSKLVDANERRTRILRQLKLRLPSSKRFENAKADPTKDGEVIIRQLGIAIAEIAPCYLASTERPRRMP